MVEPERCTECGFDGEHLMTGDAITALRSMGRRWRELFKDVPEERLRTRPDPQVWSPLEYAAHTRDVIALVGRGMNEVLKGGEPSFPSIEPDPPGDAGAVDHGYNALDPPDVLDQLAAEAEHMAERASKALPEHWSRQATTGGEATDAGWLLRHAVHDASHHLRDVERILGA
jgi:hypothetical protein